jgi:hypothetical protein
MGRPVTAGKHSGGKARQIRSIRKPEDLLIRVREANGKGFVVVLGSVAAKPFFFSGTEESLHVDHD